MFTTITLRKTLPVDPFSQVRRFCYNRWGTCKVAQQTLDLLLLSPLSCPSTLCRGPSFRFKKHLLSACKSLSLSKVLGYGDELFSFFLLSGSFMSPSPWVSGELLRRWWGYKWEGWASLVAQMVKHLPAMRETWVWSLGQEDPLEKEMATPILLPGKFHGWRSLSCYLWTRHCLKLS